MVHQMEISPGHELRNRSFDRGIMIEQVFRTENFV